MVQSFGELAKQQARSQGLNKGISTSDQQPPKETRKFPSDIPTDNTNTNVKPPKSITTTEPIDFTINPYIPKRYDEILKRAGELFNANPGLYNNEPDNAINAATQEDQQNQAISAAQQNKRKSQQDVQTRVQGELNQAKTDSGANIPDNVYTKIEDDAIEAVNSGNKTELEAAREGKKLIDKISREYEAVETVGNWTLVTRSPQGNKKTLESIRDKFKDRNDLENFADTLTAKNGLSPSKSSYLAHPVSDIKALNNAIIKLPKIPTYETLFETVPDPKLAPIKTKEVSPKLAEAMGKNGSPLAVAEELQARGYDPNIWLDYLTKNRKQLDLSEWQGRELDKPRSFVPNINDLWMFYLSGLDQLVEQ